MYPQTQKHIVKMMAEQVMPGANVGFIKDGERVITTLGHAQIIPTCEPLTPSHLYDVASLTKVIGTTTLILQLWEDGKLDISKPLHDYYPAFENQDITILELLTHTSDVQAYIENRDQLSAEELKAALLRLKPGSEQGHKVAYTDTGSLLLGFYLEEVYQKPIQTLITERVLKPLAMSHSTFKPNSEHAIAPTENHPTRGVIKGQVHDPKAFKLKENCGSAGLFSTIDDCLLFAETLLNNGTAPDGHQLLKPDTVERLISDWTTNTSHPRSLGWDLLPGRTANSPLLFHTGYTGTFMIIDVSQQEAFVFLSNRVHPVDHRQAYIDERNKLLEIYLSEKKNS
ncbi:beta-lactamase family protein [Vagococcus coleopterorum]|uniref:Beta-lactamase family protein n=1 Tax=Vagococcus coleopterorum TaxID=2714946 RepID=A0A6G8AL42_9ENTE|nr:serine hydrolase domain-containing protein [Vagococcus coleopterorum]QIL45679.1 beta-lactamase family protein [Vagococcus coleopterorum]